MGSSSRAADRARAGLLAALLGAAGRAAAQEGGAAPPVPPVPAESEASPVAVAAPVDEIIVFGDLEIARARRQLEADLRAAGYREGRRRDGVTVYRPNVAWKPSVFLYDEGFAVVRRSPVRFEPPGGIRGNKLNYLWCLPPFTPMCLRIGGWVVSNAKLNPQKQAVAEAMDPAMDRWNAALAAKAMGVRTGQEVPALLDGVWFDGAPIVPGDPLLPTPASRREAILSFWAGRACSPEGDAVRAVVALYLEQEVMTSATPLTADEVRAAEAANPCGGTLGVAPLDAGPPAP